MLKTGLNGMSRQKAVISLNIHTGNDEIEKLQGDDDADRMQNQKN